MKEFKKVVVKPMTFTDDLKLVSVSYKSYDLRGIDPDSQDLVKRIFDLIKNAPGVIVAIGTENEEGEPKFHIADVTSTAKNKSQVIIWQEPNLVHLYLQIASEHLEKSHYMINQIRGQKMVNNQTTMENYVKEVIQGIVFLVMAITAFLDILIYSLPDTITDADGNENFVDRSSYEREKFDRKLEVVPTLFDCDFKKNYSNNYHKITKLNDLRNDLVHLKSETNDNATHYKKLFKSLVDFNSKEAIDIVLDSINTIKPNYIEVV